MSSMSKKSLAFKGRMNGGDGGCGSKNCRSKGRNMNSGRPKTMMAIKVTPKT